MSYFSSKGKQVWGTSIFRINVETMSNRLSPDFSGRITLYERRHEAETLEFGNLDQFISVLKQYWQTALPNSRIQETRLARWLEEYLNEMGFRVSYDDAINAMRGEVEEVQSLEVSGEVQLGSDQITKLISESEDFMVTGITKTIKGDLTDIEGIDKVLTKFLKDNKPDRETQANSRITFKAVDGNEHEMNETRKVIEPILDEDVSLWTGFSNNLSVPVSEIAIEDVIPYSYKVISTSTSNMEQVSKEKTPEGLKFTWTCATLESGERLRIDYKLEYRMLRTILIRDDNDITLLNTYYDISRDDSETWIDATYTFKEKTDVLENVIIIDQIPNFYQFSSSQPEVVAPTGYLTQYASGVEIEWKHTNVPVNTQFQVTYELKVNIRLFRDRIILQDQSDNIIAEIMKLVKPLEKISGYGIILAIHSNEDLEKITLIDRVSKEFKINEISKERGDMNIQPEQLMQRLEWELGGLSKNDQVFAYLSYAGDAHHDLSQFTVSIPDKAALVVEKEIGQKVDRVVMPMEFEVVDS